MRIVEPEDDAEGTCYVDYGSFCFIGWAHASLIQREGVAKRGKTVTTILLDDPCNCPDEHIEVWGLRL